MARKHFCNIVGAKMDWSHYAPGEKSPETAFKQTLPIISIDDFHAANVKNFGKIAEHLKEYIEGGEGRDVRLDNGWTTASYRTSQPLINHPESLPHIIQDLFNRKAMASRAYEEALIHRELPELKANDDYYGISSPVALFKAKLLTHDIKIARDLEATSATWFNGRDWNPSIQQLEAAGMSPASARNARGIYDIEERRWPILAQTAAMAGLPTPTRIPGRLPHVWQNPYKVVGSIGPTGTHYMADFANMKEAKSVMKILQAQHPGMTWSIEKPKAHQRNQADVLMALLDAKTAIRGPGFKALIDAIEDGVAKGIISAAMSRSPIPVGGHLIDRVGETGALALSRSQLKDAGKLWETTGRTLYKWHSTVKFIVEVLRPMEQYGMLPESTNLRANAMTYMRDLLGSPEIIFRQASDGMRSALIERGMNPALAANIANRSLAGFNIYYLMFKFDYYATNFFQNATVTANLLFKKAESSLAGEKSGSVLYASSQMLLPTAANKVARTWLLDHGYMEPALGEGMAAGGVRDHLAMAIERYTRATSGTAGNAYYRQFLTPDAALRGSGMLADEVSVNYHNRVGKPVIMTQLPDIAKPLGMFSTFPLHLMSTFSRGMRLLTQATREANPKAFLEAMSGMLALTTACMALGGLMALPFGSNYDDLVALLSKAYGKYIPDTHGIARLLGEKLKSAAEGPGGQLMSSVMQVGLLSTITQFNSSGSAGGPDLSGGAAVQVVDTAVSALLLGLRAGGALVGVDGQVMPTKDDVYGITKTLPKQWAYKFEYFLKTDSLSDVYKMVKGDMVDYAVGKDASGHTNINLRNTDRARTQLETIMLLGLGSKSTREADYDRTDRIFQQQQQADQKHIEQSMKRLTEIGVPDEERDKLVTDLMTNYYKNLNPMLKGILDAEKAKSMNTDEDRRAMEAHTLPGMIKVDKWKELHKQDNTARPADLLK